MMLHFFMVAIAVLVVKEEYDIWDGVLDKDDGVLGSINFVKSLPVLAVSTALFFIFLAMAELEWDAVTPYHIVADEMRPLCKSVLCRHIAYLATLPHLSGAFEYLNLAVKPQYTKLGSYFNNALDTLTWLCILGVFPALYKQWKEINNLVVGLERCVAKKDGKTLNYLQNRASRAPSVIKRKVLQLAIYHDDQEVRHAAISIFPYAEIFSFPATFIHNLDSQNDKNKLDGLKKIREFLRKKADKIDLHQAKATLNALVHQTGKNRSEHNADVLEQADAALLECAQLAMEAAQREPSSPDAKGANEPKVAHLVVLTADKGVRQRALELASKTDNINLCIQVARRVDQFADLSWRSTVLSECVKIVEAQHEHWQRAKVSELRNAIKESLKRARKAPEITKGLNDLMMALNGRRAPSRSPRGAGRRFRLAPNFRRGAQRSLPAQ
jgi:hypothetical protein